MSGGVRKPPVLALTAAAFLALQPGSAQAAEVDCTTGCDVGFAGLWWSTDQYQPAGTGYIDPFLRIQLNRLEEGMSTDYRPLELCLSDEPPQYNAAGGGCGTVASTPFYNLDSSEDNSVLLDYDYLGTGSGGSDPYVYIPVGMLAGATADTYFYLWSQFGFDGNDRRNGRNSQDGFAEWRVRAGFEPPDPLNPVPEPATLALFGAGLAAAGFRLRRTRRRS